MVHSALSFGLGFATKLLAGTRLAFGLPTSIHFRIGLDFPFETRLNFNYLVHWEAHPMINFNSITKAS